MHVEAKQRDVGESIGQLGDTPRVIERHPELVAALSRADVLVRRVDRNLRIDPDGDRCAHAPPARDLVDEEELALRLDVDEQDTGIERFLELPLGLPYSAKDDVVSLEAREHRAIELTAGDDVRSPA